MRESPRRHSRLAVEYESRTNRPAIPASAEQIGLQTMLRRGQCFTLVNQPGWLVVHNLPNPQIVAQLFNAGQDPFFVRIPICLRRKRFPFHGWPQGVDRDKFHCGETIRAKKFFARGIIDHWWINRAQAGHWWRHLAARQAQPKANEARRFPKQEPEMVSILLVSKHEGHRAETVLR